jgi:beta-glucosidase
VADSYPEAQAQSLQAGMDVELANGYRDLLSLVKSGRVSERDIDRSVRRVLTAKFKLGLFEHPFVDPAKADSIVRCEKHKQLALAAARETMTLLKNERNTLPLSDQAVKRIGVFGPAADALSLGDYTGPVGGWKGEGAVTPYAGLVKRLGKSEVILYRPGTDPAALAKTCDVVLFFASVREGEAQDRSNLALPSAVFETARSHDDAVIVDTQAGTDIPIDQEKMILDLAATRVKMIVILQNGAPIDIRSWMDNVPAILEAWYPGEQGGTAIAETLFGDVDPGGRLPITWPKRVGQVPVYYAVKPSGRGYAYIDDDGKPLFPFGYGLSYTTFAYSNFVLPPNVKKEQNIKVKVTVTNTGKEKGEEVVQLYLHQVLASVVRPVKELKAFQRITLGPGETREVTLLLPYRSFGLWDKRLNFVVEPGLFEVYIGRNAETNVLEGKLMVE